MKYDLTGIQDELTCIVERAAGVSRQEMRTLLENYRVAVYAYMETWIDDEIDRLYLEKTEEIKERLEYLRKELRAERISHGELAELQTLAPHIEAGDIELLEAAGVPEFPEAA